MAKVVILQSLVVEIKKKFNKKEANEIIDLMGSVEKSPRKGKTLSSYGGIVIKELKYKVFRFYFITDGHILKFADEHAFVNLLVQFVRMSDKKHQQKAIEEIRRILKLVGPVGFV